MMSLPLIFLVSAIALFAALLVTHVVLLNFVFRSELPNRWKAASLLPILTPAVAWRARCRRSTIAWIVLLGAYLIVRIIGD